MFNNLANYLLGGTNQQARPNEEIEEENIRLTSVVVSGLDDGSDDNGTDEWVFVDRDSEGNSELSSEESECEPNVTENDRFETLLSRTSSSSSLPCLVGGNKRSATTTMEDSWFLTPPPCFVSSGPVHMETSPLENLLIEHPSMSVYQQPAVLIRRTLPNGASVEDDVVEFPEEDEEYSMHSTAAAAAAANATLAAQLLQQRTRASNNNAASNRALVRAEVIVQRAKQGAKHAQKVQMQKACQSLKRGHLERNNKAREVNCRNQRLRRGERSQGATRSHANNNRKC